MITDIDKHLTDQEFFTYIKFFNLIFENEPIENYDEKDNVFKIENLIIGKEDLGYAYNRIGLGGQVLEASVEIKKGHKFNEEIEEAKKLAEKKPEKEKEKLLKTIKDIEDDKKIKISNISDISWIWYGIYSHIRFTPRQYKIPKEIEQIFRTEMNKYLDNFINNKLKIIKKNYYQFEAQKKVLIQLIEEDKKISLYGNNFIIKEKIDENCVLKRIPDFCIIQTVYALQKLGYLKVVNVWEEIEYKSDYYNSEKDIIRYVNVNLILDDTFIKEINNKYKKDNPKNTFEKFDAKKGVLKFAGKEIELSKKGKETDAVLLMKTLLEIKNDDWKYNDEILTDWGYNDDDQKDTPKNKVYFAGQKINNAIALKTQIEDFIECNTSKARINPKYRKIDE